MGQLKSMICRGIGLDSTFNGLDDMWDEPSPTCSLPLAHPWAGFHSNLVLQKVAEVHDCVGISCEGFSKNNLKSSCCY